jgi:hypothetical protein
MTRRKARDDPRRRLEAGARAQNVRVKNTALAILLFLRER